MRDILLTLVIAGLLPVALFRPYVGALLWAWISIMNPHTLTYGFARSLPWAQMTAIVTILSFAFNSKRRYGLPWSFGTACLLLLMLWTTVTSAFSLNNPSEVWDRYIFFAKIVGMLLITLMVTRGRKQIEGLIWVMVVSIGFFGVKGGLFTVLTGGGSRVWGPPGGMMADNNSIAIGLIIILPWMYYLQKTATRRWITRGMGVAMLFTVFAILGTQSRGALLGLLAMALLLGLKGKHAILTTLGLALLVTLAIAFMPDTWTDRMNTIGTYQADTSAMSRLWTWKTLWNLALDRPLVGGGFRSDSLQVFSVYSPVEGRGAFLNEVYVAHSIYLQALGEHGFPGLIFYLGVGIWTWVAAGRLGRQTADDPELSTWVPLLMRMCQASIAGFAVGGAFLSLMVLDLPYYVFAVVLLTRASIPPMRAVHKAPAGPVGMVGQPAGPMT